MTRRIALVLLVGAVGAGARPGAVAQPKGKDAPKADALPKVGAVPEAARKGWKLDAYYSKYADAGGLPVVASKNVDDRAVAVAAYVVTNMLAERPDVLKALAEARVRVAVIGKDEQTTDLPEYAGLRPEAEKWNKRSRGLGATRSRPAASAGEENLLGLPGDRYKGESILVHEFGHTVHEMGLSALDPKFEPRLKDVYAAAMKKGLWARTYAATDFKEYWAEGVQSYFDANMVVKAPDGVHNGVATRAELKTYDPALYELIDDAFRSPKWTTARPLPAK
jgi:alpha-glucosidase